MSAQTTYPINTVKGYHGALADLNPAEIVSYAAEGSVAIGVAVSLGTDKEKQVVAGGDGTYFGISLRSLDQEGALGTGALSYADTTSVPVIRRGYVYLTAPAGATAGDAVKYTDTTGVIGAGAPGAGETAVTGASWVTSPTAGAIGLVRLA